MDSLPEGTIYKTSDGKIIVTREYWDHAGIYGWRLWELCPRFTFFGMTIIKPFWRDKALGRVVDLDAKNSWIKHYNMEPVNA